MDSVAVSVAALGAVLTSLATLLSFRNLVVKHTAVERLRELIKRNDELHALLAELRASGNMDEQNLRFLEKRLLQEAEQLEAKYRAKALEGIEQPSAEGRQNYMARLAS